MQISREFILLGGKQNKTPRSLPSPARDPRSCPLPALPRGHAGARAGQEGLCRTRFCSPCSRRLFFANIDIAACVQRIINCHCGDAVRPGPGALRCGRPPASRHWRAAGRTVPAETARSGGGRGPGGGKRSHARRTRNLSQLGCVGWISFFQYLFLIPLLLETPKPPSVAGFPLCFKRI